MSKEKMNSLLRSIEKRQLSKKITNPSRRSISKLFLSNMPSKKRMCDKEFLEALVC